MPFALDVRVYPKNDCRLPHPCSHMLHAAVLSRVRESDPALSAALHGNAQVKPFSISTLWPRVRAKGDCLEFPKYTECRFRLCALNKSTFDSISSPFFSMVAGKSPFSIGANEFFMLDTILDRQGGAVLSYEDLWTDMGDEIALRFSSPTTFRRKGISYPLPDPALVYGSLWQKWRAFSDLQVNERVYEALIESLGVSRLNIRTRAWKFPNVTMNGFSGIVHYSLLKNTDADVRHLFGALSGLAFFSGVGYKTTMGMGQCGILREKETEEKEES